MKVLHKLHVYRIETQFMWNADRNLRPLYPVIPFPVTLSDL